jgi:hypothetical protein
MIHELREYTVLPGSLAQYVEFTRTVAMPIREDRYGILRGYWTALSGNLNRVVHLWEYSDMGERTQVRAPLSQDTRWISEYSSKAQSYLVKQENQIIEPLVWAAKSGSERGIYELRTDHVSPGTVPQWSEVVQECGEKRARAGELTAVWKTEIGTLNTVLHLWRHSSAEEAVAATEVAAPPAEFGPGTVAGGPILRSSAVLLRPASFSPLR